MSPPSDFIRNIVEADREANKHGGRVMTRFPPEPNGYLHIGHAQATAIDFGIASEFGGVCNLRFDDTNPTKENVEYVNSIEEDLRWLGMEWDGPVWRQSDRLPIYADALARLDTLGLTYPCFCTRADIAREIERSGAAPHGPEGALYPRICAHLLAEERQERLDAGQPHAVRLDVAAAMMRCGPLEWRDEDQGIIAARADLLGDVVLARKDAPVSYHLAVTVDDAAQGVTLVTRGEDLLHATHIHRILQALLDLPEPEYWHHRLLRDSDGRRYAKRDRAQTIQALRQSGMTPSEVRRMAGYPGSAVP